jgi:Na+/melibiose symporter-like transporter
MSSDAEILSPRGFAVGMGIALVFFLGVASFGLVLTLFLQQGLGFTPLNAGATFIPFSAGVFVASGAAARLEPKFGRGVTVSGALIMAAGTAALIGIGLAFLLMLALPARRGHNRRAASV